MGEATPAQPTVGGFVPMLGGGMVGSMPGGVNGPIATSRGSAVPQLHSAIVERLRARIELCRRHHSTCENRYQRGQAENSDREHESTLHLLNIVQQGPGNRKTKGSRGSNHQPPEYNRANGEPKGQSSEGEQKISTRIALQGSLRRKIEGHAPGYSNKQNGLACGLSGPDFKRVRMEAGGLAHGPCAFNPAQPQPHQGPSSAMGNNHSNHGGLQRKSYMMPHGVGSDLFHMTLKEMKKEPVDSVQSCGQSASTEMMVFDFKDEGGGQIDPDLQDLFDELTKTVPSLNDLEFEKMLKQDDAFGLDLGGRPSSAGAAAAAAAAASANLCSQLEKTIKTEYSPDYGQVHCGSPQLRPASAGPSFTMGGGSSPLTPGQKANGQGGHPRGMAGWPEVSHAEQLKQMAAANQQQPSALHHHHHHHHHHNHHQLQQQPPGGVTSWAPAMSTHSSGSPFPQDKLSSSATLGQQRLSPQRGSSLLAPILTNSSQSKGINAANNNCLFKPSNGHSDSSHLDIKVHGTKPMLHFTPKTAHSVNQPVMPGQLNKTPAPQQQQTVAGQNPSHTGLQYQNQQMAMPGSPCLQPKPMTQRTALNQHGPSLHFKLAQQRQGMLPGPHLPANGSGVGMPSQGQSQLRATVPNNQQKNTGKTQAMQRQLNQPQHIISDAEKDSAQDQFNRHLTRPPPDYKQTRNMVVQQGNLFQGMTSSQSLPTSSPEGDLQPMPCHLPNGPGSKMTPPSSDRRFGPDPHPGSCIGQLQPQHSSNQNRLGINQNKLRFPGKPGNHGNAFGVNGNVQQHPRTAAGQQSTGGVSIGGAGGGIGNMMSNVMGWSSPGSKPTNAVGTGGLGIRRLHNPIQPQGGQLDMIRHPYQQQRSVGPPNQVAPDIRMHPLSSSTLRGSTPRSNQPTMMAPLPSVGGSLNLSPPEQRVPPGAGSFPATAPSPNPGNYQNNRASRLTFDFLQEGDNTVPGINTDSDFIDSLLKSGSGNDDWMKDINLDEILGGHS